MASDYGVKMKLKVERTLDSTQRSKWIDFLERCENSHARQHPVFAFAEHGKGRHAIFVWGEEGGEIVSVAIFSLNNLCKFHWFILDAVALSGPCFLDAKTGQEFIKLFIDYAKKRHMSNVRISPYWFYPEAEVLEKAIRDLGFIPMKGRGGESNRQYTGIVDISLSKDEILANFSKSARREVRRATRQEVTVKYASTFLEAQLFYNALNDMNRDRHMPVVSENEYTEMYNNIFNTQDVGVIINAYKGGVFLGGIWLMRVGNNANVSQFVVSPEALHNLSNLRIAPFIWYEAMCWAKDKGCKNFDVEGYVEDVDKSNPMYNIYKYKREFSPKGVYRINEYIFVISRAKYNIQHGFDVINKAKRRIIKYFQIGFTKIMSLR